MPQGPQRHPSRDTTPAAPYEQGQLFDPDVHEANVRQELVAKRMGHVVPNQKVAVQELMGHVTSHSVIPTSHLQPRRGMFSGGELPETKMVLDPGLEGTRSGEYVGPSVPTRGDYIRVSAASTDIPTTIMHEMGHRHHIGEREMSVLEPEFGHPKGMFPNPQMEGVADAYVDRYGGPHSENVQRMQEDLRDTGKTFPSYQSTGYSTRYPRWGKDDQAIYAGTRGHFSETGEIHDYVHAEPHPEERHGDWVPDASVDATIHSLISNSSHAWQAMEQTGLGDTGAQAFRRHRDRQLLKEGQEVQGSLFHEMKGMNTGKTYGYTPSPEATEHLSLPERSAGFDADLDAADVGAHAAGEEAWPEHMSHNQFGEAPRSWPDVLGTLGVQRHISTARGFTG